MLMSRLQERLNIDATMLRSRPSENLTNDETNQQKSRIQAKNSDTTMLMSRLQEKLNIDATMLRSRPSEN